MSTSKGPVEGWLRVLKPQEVEAIQRAALRVLSQVGIELGDLAFRELFVDKGAKAVGHRTYIPGSVVQEALELVPHKLTLYRPGRRPDPGCWAGPRPPRHRRRCESRKRQFENQEGAAHIALKERRSDGGTAWTAKRGVPAVQ